MQEKIKWNKERKRDKKEIKKEIKDQYEYGGFSLIFHSSGFGIENCSSSSSSEEVDWDVDEEMLKFVKKKSQKNWVQIY